MAQSRLHIKNMALDELPTDRIETESEASVQAEILATEYQPALEMLLEDYDWDFAVARQTLAAVTNDREQEWSYAYALPSDMARPRHLLRFGADEIAASYPGYSVVGFLRGFESITPYRIASGKIYTNRDSAILEYISNAPGEATFPAKFARALALELASRAVMPIKKDRQRQGDLIKAAEVARERAKADAMNRDREGLRDFIPDMLLARMGALPW